MPHIYYLPNEREFETSKDETILQVSLRSGIPHTHVCGRYARCSTCRVSILEGLEHCTPRNVREQAMAERLRFGPMIRLACQTTVTGDVKLRRLVLDAEDVEITSQLGSGGTTPGAVGQEKRVAILFADIRGFTAFAEALPPYDVVHVLNRYFYLMGQVISRHRGYIDNYMGDGLMALFGVEDPAQAPLRAVMAGLEMLEIVEERLQPYLEALYKRSWHIRIGVHYGAAVVGAIGAPDRKRVTANGDAVNFASRIEAANKAAGTRLLVSEDVYQQVSEQVRVNRTVRATLPGKSGDYMLYEVTGLKEQPTRGYLGGRMLHYKYLIIGGGMTADAAVHGIRQVDPEGSIGLLSAEADPPYNRPPLSKGLWKGKSVERIWRKTEDQGVTLHLGCQVQVLDPKNKRATDAQGAVYTFDKLLVATGGTPRRFPFGDDQIIYFRTVADYRRLRALAEQGKRFAVIGGGFIGSEIAAALAMNGKEVMIVFPGEGIGARMFPRDLALFLNDFYRQKGVEVLAKESVVGLETRGTRLALKTQSQREILVDGIVAGIGIQPNVELAQAAGLKVDDGIVVDEFLHTRQPDIYAAGDVAAFRNPALGKRLRAEHEDNANTMGRVAGLNMAGASEPYHHLPFFYSDLFELGYEAVGEVDAQLETVADWKEPFREGVIYYLQAGRVRGVLLWNVWEQVEAARQLIAEPGSFRPENLKGRLPKAH